MPGGLDHNSGLNHPTDSGFLALEDIIYGFTRRLHESSDDDSDDSDDDDSDSGYFPPCHHRSRQRSISCPVCKNVHAYSAPKNDSVGEDNRYSHNARVIYAALGCPICLEDPAGPPMVVFPCGHAICQDDFRLLGGTTTNAQADAQVRQQASEESQQHRQHLREQREQDREQRQEQRRLANNNNGDDIDDDEDLNNIYGALAEEPMDYDAINMMRAFAASLQEAMEDDASDDDTINRRPTTRSASAQNNSANRESSSIGTNRFHQPRLESMDDDDDDDNDSDDARVVDLAEFSYGLSHYYPCNEAEYEAPEYTGFPKIGQWMLVPGSRYDENTISRLYLIYYSESAGSSGHGRSIRAVCRCERGTRLIPNGKHGVYIHSPQPYDINSELWDVFYAKNDKPGGRSDRGRRGRNYSSTNTAPDVFEPILKYMIGKKASLVSDGNGGMWALYPEASVPDSVRRPPTEASADVDTHNNSRGGGSRRGNGNSGRSNRKYKLVHYTNRQKQGLLVGDETYLAPAKMIMDQSGGVLLLARNSEARDSYAGLVHITHHNKQTLLHGGVSQGTRVVGDSNGASVFLLSAGGHLQSILSRVMIEKDPSTGSVKCKTCFSYNLDIPVGGIKDIVDGGDDMNQCYLHCRKPGDSPLWRVCLVGPQMTTANTNRNQPAAASLDRTTSPANNGGEVSIEAVSRDCPRISRIVTDRANGVWIWKRPRISVHSTDRGFLHISENGDDEWYSPIIFPPNTLVAGLR